MKLVILGNGFDLHHGYKTSFSDFRKYLLNSKNDADKELISDIDSILKSKNINLEEGILWNDFERIIGKMVENSDIKINDKSVSNLVPLFTKRFFEYLSEVVEEKFIENKKLAKEFQNADSILTFNYTNFYINYIKSKETNIFHLHGELKNENLPLIGYYYNIRPLKNTFDYMIRYRKKFFDKASLGFKQNEYDLDDRINQYVGKWGKKISEVVVIGYSFGESDSHIYKIINSVLLIQNQDINVPASRAKHIPIIKFKLYNYNSNETIKLLEKLKRTLISKANRRSFVNVTGKGFTSEKKDIITFEIIDY